MFISYYIDDFLVFSFFLSNWILMSYIRFVIRSSKTPRLSSWRCRCCSQLAPSHYQKIMTRHMTLDDQLNSTLQFTYLIFAHKTHDNGYFTFLGSQMRSLNNNSFISHYYQKLVMSTDRSFFSKSYRYWKFKIQMKNRVSGAKSFWLVYTVSHRYFGEKILTPGEKIM